MPKENNILIVASTMREVIPFMRNFAPEEQEKQRIYSFKKAKKEFTLMLTGPGLTFTSFWLGQLLAEKKFDIAFQMGICGSYHKELEIGTVVRVASEVFADMGAEDKDSFMDIFEMGLMHPNVSPFSRKKLINPSYPQYISLKSLPTADALTVNTTTGSAETAKKLMERYEADIESMEGAAFFYAMGMFDIPFYEIRAVSNFVEERNTESWNLPLATHNLNKSISHIIDEICEA